MQKAISQPATVPPLANQRLTAPELRRLLATVDREGDEQVLQAALELAGRVAPGWDEQAELPRSPRPAASKSAVGRSLAGWLGRTRNQGEPCP